VRFDAAFRHNFGGQPVTVQGKVKFFNETKGYPAANAVLSTTYGNPGGGNFTMPDLRGRFFFSLDTGGSGRITAAGGNFDGTMLGNAGGAQSRTLTAGQIPQLSFTPSGTIGGSQNLNQVVSTEIGGLTISLGAGSGGAFPGNSNVTYTVNGSNFSFNGSGGIVGNSSPSLVPTIPPAMAVNCMMRIA
jgi:microcystin-dependent protein